MMPDALDHDPSSLFFQGDGVRRSIISAYWLIILLTLPLWWYTTTIQRLSLPNSQVTFQAHNHLQIPIKLCVDVGSESASLAAEMKNAISESVENEPERWKGLDIHIDHLHHPDTTQDDAYTIVLSHGGTTVSNRQLAYPLQGSTTTGLVDVFSTLVAPFPTASEPDYWTVQYSPRYRLSFSLLNEDSAAGNHFTGWDIAEAISRHISPILSQLSVLHNFTIESQVQFHARLAFSPRPFDGMFGISPEDLSVFINSAEWTLSSSASNDPVLHFILFVPSAAHRPLRILGDEGLISLSNAFLLPQWGGIVIFNPPELAVPTSLSSASLDHIFSAFSGHLLTLLGVPNLPTGVSKISEAHQVLTDWQLDALLRYRTLGNAQGSKETLQSIVKLVDQIDNMPVGQDVRGDVQGALEALEKMYEASNTSLTETLRYSARAFTLSSRAFFNPGMLALLYFPAEHKYAVYTPMFASAFIPLFVAALRELSAWKRQRTQPVDARQ